MSTFKKRLIQDAIGGKYDSEGFFRTPNGSFWDPDGIYFNREGKDSHGGYYDSNNEYHPGKGWVESLMCYEDEVTQNQNMGFGELNEEDDGDYEDGDYDVYEDYNEDIRNRNQAYSGPSYYDIQSKQIDSKSNIVNKLTNNKENDNKIKENQPQQQPKQEKKEVDVKNNTEVKEALKANKKVECQGFQISEDLLDSDDDKDTKVRYQKGKK